MAFFQTIDGKRVRVNRDGTPFNPMNPAAGAPTLFKQGAARQGRQGTPGRRCGASLVPTQGMRFCANREKQSPFVLAQTRLGPGLLRGEAGAQFNASLYRYQGQLLLAYRTGWKGADIHIARLTDDLKVLSNTTLKLRHPRANYGREDPRLFEHDGSLWCSYIGVRGLNGSITTHQMLARLGGGASNDLSVKQIVYPHYPLRQPWEKNWQFFPLKGVLYAIYTIAPHLVLRIDDLNNRGLFEHDAVFVCRHDWTPPWMAGMLRGGASPVLLGDEYWCFFHGKTEPKLSYTMGVYTFDARPPFRPRRITPRPIYWPDPRTNPGNYCAVTFPCGAVLEGDRWRVSAGLHDRFIEVLEFSHQQIQEAMVTV